MSGSSGAPRPQPEAATAPQSRLVLLPQRHDTPPELTPPQQPLAAAIDDGTDEFDEILRENRRYRLALMRRARRRRTAPERREGGRA